MDFLNTNIKCPKCGNNFKLNQGIESEAINSVVNQIKKSSNDEIEERLKKEKEKILLEGEKKGYEKSYEENKKYLSQLNQQVEENKKIKLEQLEKDAEIKRLKDNTDINLKVALDKQQENFDEKLKALEQENKIKINALTNDLKKASEKANQGSMQLQGEIGELSIEETLKKLFPTDEVKEIKKGQKGADCVLFVKKGDRCFGKIIFESKKTKSFSTEWINKLKKDALDIDAQIPVLVTQSFPSGQEKAQLIEGVWICGFHEYQLLVKALRVSIMELNKVQLVEAERENKSQVMYSFLTSSKFANTLEQMIKPIFMMEEQLRKEKLAIESQWKKREALIEQSISGTNSLYSNIQAIAKINLPPIEGMSLIEDLIEE